MTYSTRNTRNTRNGRGREWLTGLAIVMGGIIVVTTAALVGGIAAVAITNQLHEVSATIAAVTAALGG